MAIYTDKTKEIESQASTQETFPGRSNEGNYFSHLDRRSGAIAQRKLQERGNFNSQHRQLKTFQEMADNYQGSSVSAQLKARTDNNATSQLQGFQSNENNAGLPAPLKSGIESLSGYSMDNVKVHFNSDKPAQLQAHAYTQGSDIHLASGQEKYLPHEAWHVVQQKQGRVKPTTQLKSSQLVNDDTSLEREADIMGARAATLGHQEKTGLSNPLTSRPAAGNSSSPVQLKANEMTTSSHAYPSMKEEIAAQYKQPDGRLDELWNSEDLNRRINKYQSGGLPYHSKAKLSTLDSKDIKKRPPNPDCVSIHGEIGSLEASLRAGVTDKPYDGGHLIAFNFMAAKANDYQNVAPQGKKLNNGPFSLWEDKVLGKAISETGDMLNQKGVGDIPHLFHYDVFVSYPMSSYSVSKETLIQSKLAPVEHANDMPEKFNLFKRIPLHWSAHAQPLALPSANDMAINERPNTPFLSDPTSDYGIVRGDTPNQNFSGRGPSSIVSRLNYSVEGELSEGTIQKVVRAPAQLINNPKIKKFTTLVALAEGNNGEAIMTWLLEELYFDTKSKTKLETVMDRIGMKKSKTTNKALSFRIINSDFNGELGILTPQAISAEFDAIANGQEPNFKEAMIEVIDASLQLAGTVQGLTNDKKKSKPVPTNANTLDFTTAVELSPAESQLPKYSLFRFEASDTQPG